ncbi:MAG: hypothetical protein R3324_13955, partial [Halobacteriales archaeon]|nr:hypothetical protein [Halobacteriales archaeon]
MTVSTLVERLPKLLVRNDKLVFIESVIVLFVVWSGLAHGLGLTGSISAPELVLGEMFTLIQSGDWVPHVVATLRRTLYGFGLSLLVGTPLGILMGVSEFWHRALQDYVTVGLAFPSLLAAVFAAMWFGISDLTPTVAGAIIAFPYLT